MNPIIVKPLTESIVQYDLVVAIGEDVCIPILEQGKHKLHQAYCYIAMSPRGKALCASQYKCWHTASVSSNLTIPFMAQNFFKICAKRV